MLNFGDWKKKHLLSLEPQGQPFINGWKWWFPTIFYINGWPWGSRSLWKASNFRVELRRRSQVDAVSLHMDLLMTWNREKVGPIFSRWWFEICFIFGEGFQFDEHIFQMGWNHQLVLSVRIDFFFNQQFPRWFGISFIFMVYLAKWSTLTYAYFFRWVEITNQFQGRLF